MHRVEELAWVSVARGCGFAALGIFTLMVGLAGDIPAAFKAGGILTLITSLVLFVKSWQAPTRPYKHTEVWMMLEPQNRPHDALAQTLIGHILRRTYLTFAVHSALLSSGLFAVSLLVAMFRIKPMI